MNEKKRKQLLEKVQKRFQVDAKRAAEIVDRWVPVHKTRRYTQAA